MKEQILRCRRCGSVQGEEIRDYCPYCGCPSPTYSVWEEGWDARVTWCLVGLLAIGVLVWVLQ